jgi:hypothetical protein
VRCVCCATRRCFPIKGAKWLMSDTGHEFELPIVSELGDALYAAALATDSRRRIRRLLHPGRWAHRPLVLAIFIIGTTGGVGGLALAGTFSGATISPQAWISGQRVQPDAVVTAAQSANLEILRRPRVASDALDPYDSWTLTDTPAGGTQGVNVSLSRRAQGFTSGAAWVIPGNDNIVCLVAENAQALEMNSEPGWAPSNPVARVPGASGLTACTPVSAIYNDWSAGYGGGSDAPGDYFTGGIVPDGVTQVAVATTGGSTVTFPVHENVWMGDVPSTPTAVSYSTTPDAPLATGSTTPPGSTGGVATGSSS